MLPHLLRCDIDQKNATQNAAISFAEVLHGWAPAPGSPGRTAMLTLTGIQVRDGRMALGLSQRELAEISNVAFSAIFALELYGTASPAELERIWKAFEAGGIEMVSGKLVKRPKEAG